ncbi:MAG: FecR domain-containing protein [Lentisphaeraceae bacterium]|nr:FecR domain-containing protein [Lentisphaeraceae bacterium]
MKNLTDEEIELLEQYCNESISDEDLQLLEDRLLDDADFREEARSYFAMDSFLNRDEEAVVPTSITTAQEPIAFKQKSKNYFWPMAIAASLSFVAALLILPAINQKTTTPAVAESQDVKASGFAVIDKMIGVEWESNSKVFQSGDAVGQDKIKLKKGIVHLEFFSGASVIIEGPAEFDVNSSWRGFCHKGKLRANVPPAAHGFEINTPKSKVVDLGTEFGLDVQEGEESVVVFDGEVELYAKGKDMKLLTAGKGIQTKNDTQKSISASNAESFIQTASLEDQHNAKILEKYSAWKKQSLKWTSDNRLISYYNFENEKSSFVRNMTLNPKSNLDGKIIRAERVDGRWENIEDGGALEFKKPGSRARVNIPGEFSNFTFAAWVRIDSLNREWNSLFMGDSYQIGEPHWQINEDGSLVICVRINNKPKDYHVLYRTKKSIWDPSKRGQWMHISTVYSPTQREVRHYVDGKQIYSKKITDKWFVDKLKIGPAEIGNWGQPTREDPKFALRNINGRIDELMLFDAALSSEEILKIYEAGKP